MQTRIGGKKTVLFVDLWCVCTYASIKAPHSIQQVSQHSGAQRTAPLLHARHRAPLVSPSVIHVDRPLSQRTVEAPDCIHAARHRDHAWTQELTR